MNKIDSQLNGGVYYGENLSKKGNYRALGLSFHVRSSR